MLYLAELLSVFRRNQHWILGVTLYYMQIKMSGFNCFCILSLCVFSVACLPFLWLWQTESPVDSEMNAGLILFSVVFFLLFLSLWYWAGREMSLVASKISSAGVESVKFLYSVFLWGGGGRVISWDRAITYSSLSLPQISVWRRWHQLQTASITFSFWENSQMST